MDMQSNSSFWPQARGNQYSDRDEMALIISRARDYVEHGWGQGYTGHTGTHHRDGTACNPRSNRAKRWCLIGALCRASDGRDQFAAQRVLRIVRHVIGTENMARWNDKPGREPEEVVEALSRAITVARFGVIP